MKDVIVVFMFMLVPLACVIGAINMAMQDKSGWGWFLLVAMLIAGSMSYSGGG